MNAVITVVGKDRVGIIAKVSTLLYESNINILDLSQTIMQGNFTMVMLVDVSGSSRSFKEISEALGELGPLVEDVGQEAGEASVEEEHHDVAAARYRPCKPSALLAVRLRCVCLCCRVFGRFYCALLHFCCSGSFLRDILIRLRILIAAAAGTQQKSSHRTVKELADSS